MNRLRAPLGWLLVLAVSAVVLWWSYPRALPLLLPDWQVSKSEARAIALAHIDVLGEMPEEPYVITRLASFEPVDVRIMLERDAAGRAAIAGSELGRLVTTWDVYVYGKGKRPNEWTYHVRVAPNGEVLDLVLRLAREDAGASISDADARSRADAFLVEQGFDLGRFLEPELRSQDQVSRTDKTVRYQLREQVLGDRLQYGYEVHFAGDRLAGYEIWYEDPARAEIEQALQPFTLVGNLRFFILFLVMPIIGVIFVRKYHEGVVGVDRSVRIFLLVLVAAVAFLPMVASAATQGWNFGALSRSQMTSIWSLQMLLVFFMPQALVSGLSWSVGESLCRERWGRKLAAFDALLRREWGNRTVALATLRGLSLGVLLAAVLVVPALFMPESLGSPAASMQLGPWWESGTYPGVALVLFLIVFTLYYELFGRLFLVPALTQKLGKVGGGLLATVIAGLIFWGPLGMFPMRASIPVSLAFSGFLVFVFLRWDFVTSLVASFTAQATLSAMPFLRAANPSLEVQGWIAVLACALPALVTLRHLASEKEFVYRYEDVPPHVRRIAERERQRVELETARNIQSSILPQLPSQLNGIELAHTYLPATEVGGDFYDVLALEDGRLAVAVGDVAGHGVSSGLVMSMAKSALAVQVTFDPEVEAVFGTLNRMVFQSARKRLLATLCYALLDPERRELHFASAGHLFPYRVTRDGKVEMLESVAYPLGVRPTIDVVSHVAKLEAGDLIFLCSDGLVEARPEHSEEHFGFDRVERVLASQAGNGAGVVRDAMLHELEAFVGDAPREDDLTLLVLRLPG